MLDYVWIVYYQINEFNDIIEGIFDTKDRAYNHAMFLTWGFVLNVMKIILLLFMEDVIVMIFRFVWMNMMIFQVSNLK